MIQRLRFKGLAERRRASKFVSLQMKVWVRLDEATLGTCIKASLTELERDQQEIRNYLVLEYKSELSVLFCFPPTMCLRFVFHPFRFCTCVFLTLCLRLSSLFIFLLLNKMK